MTKQDREEFILLQADVDHIKENVKDTKEVVEKFHKSLTKIESKLFNDGDTGEEGYISITKRNAQKINKLENVKVAFLSILFALGSAFGWIAKNLLDK